MGMEHDLFRHQISLMGLAKPDAYNPYAAGPKMYGPEGRPQPTTGPVERAGYVARDKKVQAKKQALLARLQSAMGGQYMSTEYLKSNGGGR